MNFSKTYILDTKAILDLLSVDRIEAIVDALVQLKERRGRLFVLGVGGSAATASHAVNDFRKLVNIEAYAPTDNVAELTARTNDNGWGSTFIDWLRVSRMNGDDAIFVISVGGGTIDASPNITAAVDYAMALGTPILGVVGRDGGRTAKMSSTVLIIPPIVEERITPHTEGIASVVLHLIVSHTALT